MSAKLGAVTTGKCILKLPLTSHTIPVAKAAVCAYASNKGFFLDQIEDLWLAIDEVFEAANGGAREFELQLWDRGEEIVLRIKVEGTAKRQIFLSKYLMDECKIEYEPEPVFVFVKRFKEG